MSEPEYSLENLKVGDTVKRIMGGPNNCIETKLKVDYITQDTITCSLWTFSKKTGGEIDDDLGWNGTTHTGSYIKSDM